MGSFGLVKVPCGGKHPRQGERSMGIQEYAHAGFARLREFGGRGHDRRNHGVVSPDTGADRRRPGIRGAEHRSASTAATIREIDGVCSSSLITVRLLRCAMRSKPMLWSRRLNADGRGLETALYLTLPRPPPSKYF